MHKISWTAVVAQVVNLLALAQGLSSPHTAQIIGGVLAIAQAALPSVFPQVNTAAASK